MDGSDSEALAFAGNSDDGSLRAEGVKLPQRVVPVPDIAFDDQLVERCVIRLLGVPRHLMDGGHMEHLPRLGDGYCQAQKQNCKNCNRRSHKLSPEKCA